MSSIERLSGILFILCIHVKFLRFRGALPVSERWPRDRRCLSVDIIGRNSYNNGMKAIVSEKGQVTIPKELRDRLGIHSGQTLDFKAENGKLVAVKKMPADAFEELFGILKSNKSTDELIREMRSEADAIDNPVDRL